MNSRESLPLATTSRKQASSLNMMSKVSSNGPAFLLRISFVNCQSSRTFFTFSQVLQVLERHAKRFAGIIEVPHVIRAKAINRTHVRTRRRKWKCQIADQAFLFRNRMMQPGMPDDRQNISSQRLRSCDDVDDQPDFMAFDLRARFSLTEGTIAAVNAELQRVSVTI